MCWCRYLTGAVLWSLNLWSLICYMSDHCQITNNASHCRVSIRIFMSWPGSHFTEFSTIQSNVLFEHVDAERFLCFICEKAWSSLALSKFECEILRISETLNEHFVRELLFIDFFKFIFITTESCSMFSNCNNCGKSFGIQYFIKIPLILRFPSY